MSTYNQLQAARFSSGLTKLAGTQQGSVLPTLGPELQAALILPSGEEDFALFGKIGFAGNAFIDPAGGTFYLTPPDGVLMIVRFTFTNFGGAAANTAVGINPSSLAGPTVPGASIATRDSRWPGAAPTIANSLVTPAAGFLVQSYILPAGAIRQSTTLTVMGNGIRNAYVQLAAAVNIAIDYEGFFRATEQQEVKP